MEIGGYLQWELLYGQQCWHPDASFSLKSGRACVRFLLETERPKRVWVPYYTCDGLTEPFDSTITAIEFYPINERMELEAPWPTLADDERIVYINYFGIKGEYAQRLEQHYGDRLWVDHTQAFFYRPRNPTSFHFNSARKFFGVPDGAYLYAPPTRQLILKKGTQRNTQYRIEHLIMRLNGMTEAGYPIFQENERLNGEGIDRVSVLSEAMLSGIDYKAAVVRRSENYHHLHQALGPTNQLPPTVLDEVGGGVPHCYPYLPRAAADRELFWKQEIYIPIFWRECVDRFDCGFDWEKRLAGDLLPLPVDHRYGREEMDQLVHAIQHYF